jgi:hypothetical protein
LAYSKESTKAGQRGYLKGDPKEHLLVKRTAGRMAAQKAQRMATPMALLLESYSTAR